MPSNEEERLPFARRYRPSTLKGYVGNQKVKEQALARIGANIKPQVVGIVGASGCGKTTFARIMAKEYACLDRDAVNGACGVCYNCKEIDEYIATGSTDNFDFIKEINIADANGKRDVSTFLEDAYNPTFGGGWKVYILDECHMATPQAQNAMLKIVEEPPEKVLFIFCTTDPENILDTLKNRWQLTLHVKKPTVSELGGLLRDICLKEDKEYDVKGLSLIASRSELTIRKALNMLEQILTEKGKATYNAVLETLDELADSELFSFFKMLLTRDITGYVNAIHNIKAKMELRSFVTNLIDFTNRGLYILNNIPVEGLTDGELKSYKNLFSQFSALEISTLISRLLDLRDSDVETKLLLLGYTGLSAPAQETASSEEVPVLDFFADEVHEEHTASTNHSLERMQPDEEKVNKRLDDLSQPASLDDILSCFGTSVVR